MGSGGGGIFGYSSCGRNHPVRDFFRGLFGKSSRSTSSYVSEEDTYDRDRATLQETIRINNALTDFRLQTEKKSDALENTIIKESRKTLDQFLNMLRMQNNKVYAGRKLNLNINAIERDNREMEDMIHGFIKKRVLKEVSLDNSECLEILQMEKGKKKEAAMNRFLDSVTSGALNALSDKLKKVIYKQSENIEEKVQVRLDEIQHSLDDTIEKFNDIKRLKGTDSTGLENEMVHIIMVSSVCDMGLGVFE